MKVFEIPDYYRSRIITPIKEFRRKGDKLKRDFTPTLLDYGIIKFWLARHFGFCYGVESALEIAYKAIAENPGKRLFLLSELIHNPEVNTDLQQRGVRFLQDTNGKQLISWSELTPDDVVITPAFGATLDIEQQLVALGVNGKKYDTTCPFVVKVWNKSLQIGQKGYTVIVHGKPAHEETRAILSHSTTAPTLVVKDMAQAHRLALFITGAQPTDQFFIEFAGQFSVGFDPVRDLQRIGVVNQTTMLASDTQNIAEYLKQTLIQRYGLRSPESIERHFANTRDTLCYATNDNQDATYELLTNAADLAVVVGGYASSNTSHLVELCQKKLPTYFIDSAQRLVSDLKINHYNLLTKQEVITEHFLPTTRPVTILLTCGSSCPDSVLEKVLLKIVSFFPEARLDETGSINFIKPEELTTNDNHDNYLSI